MSQHEHSADGTFVTGQLLRVSLATGTAEIVNSGHPQPLCLRDGRVETIELDADLPFGMLVDTCFRVQSLRREPGDRLVLVTDGLFERNPVHIDIPDLVAKSSDVHPREVVQLLTRSVARATGGDMRDDATALCLDWYGGESVRHADSGADRSRASQETPP
jgi:serine phosphatase RsbU (regulator of sigma subunit)